MRRARGSLWLAETGAYTVKIDLTVQIGEASLVATQLGAQTQIVLNAEDTE